MAQKKAVLPLTLMLTLMLTLFSLAAVASVPLVNAADTTVSILASQDSYIDSTLLNSGNNYGNETYLQVRSYSGEQLRTLVQFDLSPITSDATITSATLKLYYAWHYGGSDQAPAGRTYWAYRLTQSWTETGVSWREYDGTNVWDGGEYVTAGGASTTMPSSLPMWVQWDVTNIVTAWVEDGEPNYGFLIRDGDEEQTTSKYHAAFCSREYTNIPNQNPILEITYKIPEHATIQPSSQDAYISEWSSTTNNGGSESLLVYGQEDYAFRTLVQFDLSSIPSGSTISSAELKLYCYNIIPVWGVDGSGDRTYMAYRITHSWTEMGVSWNYYADHPNAWTTPGGDYTEDGASSSTAPSSADVWMSWAVTDIVKAWIEDGEPNYGFLIKDSVEVGTNVQHNFWSREYTGDATLRPMLEIAYVPPAPAIESCDGSGATKNEFNPGDAVHVVGSGYGSSESYVLKIVSDTDWSDGMAIPSPVVEATVTSDSSGNVAPTLIWGGATPGRYDIIVDVNSNDEYDAGIDALDDFDVETAGFFVIPEFWLGTLLGLTGFFTAFGTYYMSKRRRIYSYH